MRAFFLALFTLLMLPLAALAQSADRPNTILVLDGSGSMWGQIDGVNKIVIAREVIAEMLADMADDVSLGLTVYGHRQRGSCTDIETIVSPAPGTQDEILAAVNAINPRGRTPMTDAVIAAAQSLRSTEEAATVILVSDGIENCNPDPCAIAAELEATGVDFTAHVIGFDVASEPEARAQMQCIADNTGGQFLTADNATELGEALETVVAIAPTPMRIEAQVLPEGALPTRPVSWTLLGTDGDTVSTGIQGPAIDVSLFPGTYIAQATRTEPNGPQTYQTSFTVIDGQTDLVIVAMPPIIDTSQITFTARVRPDMSVPASQLAWTLFDSADTALLGPVVAPGGNVALLPGDYRLEVERANAGTRHEARFTVEPNTPQEVIVPLPALTVEIDFVARIGSVGGVTITDPVIWDVEPLQTNPVTSNPATFQMSRGAYRVTAYWTAQEIEQSVDFVVVDQPRQIVVVFPEPVPQASLTAVGQARAGDTIEVAWTGPGAEGDWIGFYPTANTSNHSYDALTPRLSPAEGNPQRMRVPPLPGTYELRYILAENGRQVLARLPFEVLPQPASVEAASGIAGDTGTVTWTGPNFSDDWIGYYRVDDTASHSYDALTRVQLNGETSPTALNYPAEAGTYELRYVMALGRTVLARQIVEVTEVQATLTTSATGTAGAQAEVGWTGPAYDGDWIGFIDPADTSNHSYDFATRVAVAEGNPVRLNYPAAPGTYELRYIQRQGRQVLARMTVEVTEVQATLTTAATGIAGAQAEVGWTGPAYDGDWIGFIDPADTSNHSYDFATRVAVAEGNPVRLNYPAAPGTYELRYIQRQGRQVLARMTVEVTEVQATLTTAATGETGQFAEVGWTGPAYDRDWIGFIDPADTSNHSYDFATRAAVAEGNPLRLQYPATPGTYELRYIQYQGRQVLARMTVEVSEADAALTLPDTAVAGSMIEVAWVGPDAPRDYIGIGPDGASGGAQWQNYTRTADGNPLQLQVPPTPGTYRVQYFLHQGNTSLLSALLTVTPAEASVTLPASAVAGSTVEVGWTGPNYHRDYIGIGPAGASGGAQWQNYSRTADGNPVQLLVPSEPGTYEVSYFMNQGNTELATATLEVTSVGASITAPATAVAGSTIELAWTGPDYHRDYIGIGPVDATGGERWQNYTRTEEGPILRLQTPPEAGEYVIRYFLNQDRSVLAEARITLTEAASSITAPTTAVAGSVIEVAWTGPDYHRDFIGIGPVGATGGERWQNYTRTEEGSPLMLLTPPEAGTYVIRYFVDQDRVVQAEAEITLTAPAATLTAPTTAPVGSVVELGWTGPDYHRDFIAIGAVGATGGAQWQNYTRTSEGSPLTLLMPTEPGEYLIRYFIDQDRVAIAEVPMTLTDVTATLAAPTVAPAGGTVEVQWTGPDYHRDFIGLGLVGATGGGQWQSYARTSEGSTVTLNVPETPGSYVLRYFMDQDRRAIAELPITVQ
ncbi:VWA domain-containing protein [Gymnodinialimonas sp. 57CJ19]|uniref:VWA domain-containing protein n=1 Tax=Gymnodinialimonas sp. 57CJ19 TaxID=3138498 RepID=UPI0031344E5C